MVASISSLWVAARSASHPHHICIPDSLWNHSFPLMGRTGGLCCHPKAPRDLSVRTKSSAPVKEEAGARKGVDDPDHSFFHCVKEGS